MTDFFWNWSFFYAKKIYFKLKILKEKNYDKN